MVPSRRSARGGALTTALVGTVVSAIAAPVFVGAAPPAPSVKDVMKKVGAYVEAYGERAAIVVASEHYTQEVRGTAAAEPRYRVIRADFAIVRVNSYERFQGFRDVLEVDGQKQSDREDRLVRTLLDARGDYGEAARMSNESARFNIGAVQRNFNVPTTALFFFQPDFQDRFKFSSKQVARDGTWQIHFRETESPTFIRTPWGASLPSEGDLWVKPEDGTVLRTVLRTPLMWRESNKPRGYAHIDVTYRFVDTLDMWLPARMDEEFEGTIPGGVTDRVTGHAEYSNYRKFTTSGRIK